MNYLTVYSETIGCDSNDDLQKFIDAQTTVLKDRFGTKLEFPLLVDDSKSTLYIYSNYDLSVTESHGTAAVEIDSYSNMGQRVYATFSLDVSISRKGRVSMSYAVSFTAVPGLSSSTGSLRSRVSFEKNAITYLALSSAIRLAITEYHRRLHNAIIEL